MSSLKQIEYQEHVEVKTKESEQMELPFAKDSQDSNQKENSNVVSIATHVAYQAEIAELTNKKNELLSEIERLNQYSQQNSKKIQQAKSFIEQYERVVTNKEKYISEVESEKNKIIHEIEVLHKNKKLEIEELELIKSQISDFKKQYQIELQQLQTWDNKVLQKQQDYQQIQSKYASTEDSVAVVEQKIKTLERNLKEVGDQYVLKQGELIALEGKLESLKYQIEDKLIETEKISEIQSKLLQSHEKAEKSLAQSIERLKSDERTWRAVTEERYQQVEKAGQQLEAMNHEIQEIKDELVRLKIEKENTRNQVTHVENLVLNEKQELGNLQDQKFELESKYIQMKDMAKELELTISRESAELEHIREKKWREKLELKKTEEDKELNLEILKELEFKKQDLYNEQVKLRSEMLEKVHHESMLLQKESETQRKLHEVEFKKQLTVESDQMRENFWLGLKPKLDALSHEVVLYLSNCFQINLNEEQTTKLKQHIFSLSKYYEDLHSAHKSKTVQYYFKLCQPYLLAAVLVMQLTFLAYYFVK